LAPNYFSTMASMESTSTETVVPDKYVSQSSSSSSSSSYYFVYSSAYMCIHRKSLSFKVVYILLEGHAQLFFLVVFVVNINDFIATMHVYVIMLRNRYGKLANIIYIN
jgi:hypothetical protein